MIKVEFDEIYNTYSPKIFRVCLGYFNDYDLAKDITQDTFISVWENLESFQNKSSIGTWIYKIATNKCLRQIQKRKLYPNANLPFQLKNEEYNEDTDQNLAKLYQYISELPEIDKIIITLYLEEIPHEEIAEIVGISHANVRVKFHRIKDKITQKFKKNG